MDSENSQSEIPSKNRQAETNELLVRWAKLSENAFEPVRDALVTMLRSAYDVKIPAFSNALVKTDIQLSLPKDYHAFIVEPSELNLGSDVRVGVGLIDSNYRGNVSAAIFNHSAEGLEVKRGERVAQLVYGRSFIPHLEEVSDMALYDRGLCLIRCTEPRNVLDINGDLNPDCPKPQSKQTDEYILIEDINIVESPPTADAATSTNGAKKKGGTIAEGVAKEGITTEELAMEVSATEDIANDSPAAERTTAEDASKALDVSEIATELSTQLTPRKRRMQRQLETSKMLKLK